MMRGMKKQNNREKIRTTAERWIEHIAISLKMINQNTSRASWKDNCELPALGLLHILIILVGH